MAETSNPARQAPQTGYPLGPPPWRARALPGSPKESPEWNMRAESLAYCNDDDERAPVLGQLGAASDAVISALKAGGPDKEPGPRLGIYTYVPSWLPSATARATSSSTARSATICSDSSSLWTTETSPPAHSEIKSQHIILGFGQDWGETISVGKPELYLSAEVRNP